MNTLNKTFLPVTLDECHARGWDAPDFVYVCGDAYVDHPSFGLAIISRILEKAGYRVAMLCLPPWQDASAFKQFGKPRLGFLVSAGVIDSMVNHYTVAKKRRHDDAYAPGGKGFMRPDRATIVYCNRIRQAYRDVPILIGGVEASLRRFSHYDYWDDKVRHSILVGKIFGYSWQMSMAIGSSCLFGFPGTVIISNEVSESTGATPEERAAINAQIMPKMLVAGMVTVSVTSVLVAGVMSGWL